MADLKRSLTNIFLNQAGLNTDEETLKKALIGWWKNPRQKTEGGLALTEEGFNFLSGVLGLKSYKIPFPKDFQLTTQILLFMDQHIDCPHYYNKKNIVVFNERVACELLLFSGDVRKYGVAKAMARQREINPL
jgi:hypothetical protein